MSPKDTPTDETTESPTFDQSLGRLEQIVVELEGGGLGLESSLDRYKEGVGLLKGCRERLAAFRAQVEELKPDGTLVTGNDSSGGARTAASAQRSGSPRSGPARSGTSGVDPELDTPF